MAPDAEDLEVLEFVRPSVRQRQDVVPVRVRQLHGGLAVSAPPSLLVQDFPAVFLRPSAARGTAELDAEALGHLGQALPPVDELVGPVELEPRHRRVEDLSLIHI